MNDLISRNALCEYCLNLKDRTIDANDIMRFPSAEAERKWWCNLCASYDKQSCYCNLHGIWVASDFGCKAFGPYCEGEDTDEDAR